MSTVHVFQHASETIRYVEHPSFADQTAAGEWRGGWDQTADEREFAVGHMADDLTRTCARRMHYAAFRAHHAHGSGDARRWCDRYYALRDRIILGNRKLVFGAVRKQLYQNSTDDLIGECYLVMIRAVAAYNPWLGIRFSTYAYTCLIRALGRMAQRSAADRLTQHLSLDHVVGMEPVDHSVETPGSPEGHVEEFLRDGHPLLSDREKMVIRRRFHLAGTPDGTTLEKVGRDLGISKERVRQVQASALEKLRHALGATDVPALSR